MAPLTLTEKYDDLVRCADQPLSSYSRLNNKDLEDIFSKICPFIIESITYIPLSFPLTGEVYIKLERRLKIHFPLYSEAAKRNQQKFPNRKPIRHHANTYLTDPESLSSDTNSTFSFDNGLKINIPVLKECCRCGNYSQLENLCLTANTSVENIHFDNHDTVLHESIKFNNKQLTTELIRRKFNININGELGTPLVTAMHYNVLWAVEILLINEADLTKRHIDWPFLTLYEYCIQFAKIDIKLMIDKHILSLIHKRKYTVIRQLINAGWNIDLKKRRYLHRITKIK